MPGLYLPNAFRKETKVSKSTYTFGPSMSNMFFDAAYLLMLLWSVCSNAFGDPGERTGADDKFCERESRRGALPGTACCLPGSGGGSLDTGILTNQTTLFSTSKNTPILIYFSTLVFFSFIHHVYFPA